MVPSSSQKCTAPTGILQARKHLRSATWEKRHEATKRLLVLKDGSELKQYHSAQICSLLAKYGDPEDVDNGKLALECVHLCREIIDIERLHPESNARQPFDDLILDARSVLKALRDEEEATDQNAMALGFAHDRQSVQGIHTTVEDETEGYDDEFGEDDEMEPEHDEGCCCEGCEVYVDGNEDEEEQAIVPTGYATFEDEMEALIEAEHTRQIRTIYINSSIPKNPDPLALENRITVPDNFEVRAIEDDEKEDTFMECEVDVQEARLVQVFIMFLAQNRADMERLLFNYSTVERQLTIQDVEAQIPPTGVQFSGLVIRTCSSQLAKLRGLTIVAGTKPREIEPPRDEEVL